MRRKVLQKIGKLYFPLLGQDLFENTIFVFVVSVAQATRLGSEEMAIYKLLDLIGGIFGTSDLCICRGSGRLMYYRAMGQETIRRRDNIRRQEYGQQTMVVLAAVRGVQDFFRQYIWLDHSRSKDHRWSGRDFLDACSNS
ncbi:MAG: hypothetical protein ACLRMN_09610 [Mediterraneibacter gnavus]